MVLYAHTLVPNYVSRTTLLKTLDAKIIKKLVVHFRDTSLKLRLK